MNVCRCRHPARELLRTLALFAVLLLILTASGCAKDRYSTDPESERIQRLTDFCIGYGALRDAATQFIKVDAKRTDPVLSVTLVQNYQAAREFIKPFCSPTFDPRSDAFSLEALNEKLFDIRLILLEKENQ